MLQLIFWTNSHFSHISQFVWNFKNGAFFSCLGFGSMNPDPAFQVNPDPDTDPGFWRKKYIWNFVFFFWSKIAIYWSVGLHKGRPSYRRSLQPSKENIQHIKRWNLLTVFYFSAPFTPSWIRIPIQGPHWIRIQSGSTTLAEWMFI